MKHIFFFALLSICILQASAGPFIEKPVLPLNYIINNNVPEGIGLQVESGNSRMQAAVFKNQQYCRAELKDFEFDAHFVVVSATVYFSGTNFVKFEKGNITSNSLEPIKSQMARCAPGTIVVFDDVRVKDPDNTFRTITGISLVLY